MCSIYDHGSQDVAFVHPTCQYAGIVQNTCCICVHRVTSGKDLFHIIYDSNIVCLISYHSSKVILQASFGRRCHVDMKILG